MISKAQLLVTGGTGFIGRNLLVKLVEENVQVIALYRNKIESPVDGVEYKKYEGMTSGFDWSTLLKDVSTIIHCAARVHILNETDDDPISAFRAVNVDATLDMAKAAAILGVRRFIFISSIGVLGAETFEKPFSSESTANPYSPYTQSKYEAEQALRLLESKTNLEVVIIRPPLVYGFQAPGNFGRLLNIVEKGLPLPFLNCQNKRSFIAVENLINLIIHCLYNKTATVRPIVVSDGKAVSTGELILAISSALGKKPKLFWFPPKLLRMILEILGKANMAQQLCGSLEIDSSLSIERLSWTPPVSMKKVLEDMVLKNKMKEDGL